MENLLCQRFNFFLVLFGLFLAGGFGANEQQKSLIFGIGFFCRTDDVVNGLQGACKT